MQVAAVYSFNGGKEQITHAYPDLMVEVNQAINEVNAAQHKTKISTEKTMPGKVLYSPKSLNKAFKKEFLKRLEWQAIRVSCDYPTEYYVEGYNSSRLRSGAFREMDFVKQRLGVEVQFGKYAFMVYNVCEDDDFS